MPRNSWTPLDTLALVFFVAFMFCLIVWVLTQITN